MAGFLQYSANDPLIIEAWAGSGIEPEQILKARERAVMVREYLVDKFLLQPNYVGAMPMNGVAPSTAAADDGVGLSLFVPRNRR